MNGTGMPEDMNARSSSSHRSGKHEEPRDTLDLQTIPKNQTSGFDHSKRKDADDLDQHDDHLQKKCHDEIFKKPAEGVESHDNGVNFETIESNGNGVNEISTSTDQSAASRSAQPKEGQEKAKVDGDISERRLDSEASTAEPTVTPSTIKPLQPTTLPRNEVVGNEPVGHLLEKEPSTGNQDVLSAVPQRVLQQPQDLEGSKQMKGNDESVRSTSEPTTTTTIDHPEDLNTKPAGKGTASGGNYQTEGTIHDPMTVPEQAMEDSSIKENVTAPTDVGTGRLSGTSRRSGTSRSTRKSSLINRKLPTEILLSSPPEMEMTGFRLSPLDGLHEADRRDQDDRKESLPLFHRLLCLSPNYTLKSQVILSFGTVNFVTILIVVATCIVVSYVVGENVKGINRDAFENKLIPRLKTRTVRYLAESIEKQFMPVDLVDIIEEAAQDRFAGYPNSLLNETESQVPFKDSITGQNIYPVVGDPLFFDFKIQRDVNETNYEEHVQKSRWDNFISTLRAASTRNAKFEFQGACDPNVTDEMHPSYWPNCTSANNDLTTGGVIQPVPITEKIHDASKDLIPLIKAIYESTPQIRDLGLFFHSMGAGASFNFPAYPHDTQVTYNSIGCEWMAAANPLEPSLGPIGTPEEISRCHPEGEAVSSRAYNPMERGWCRDQALNPKKTFLDTYVDAYIKNHWLLSIGRAIYDRNTNAFVACIYIGVSPVIN